MRVVAGTLRGRPIVAPEGEATRPTTDRAREATFNSLVSLGAVEDAKVVDLFAGSGAMGIEALSRGASSCAFLERDRNALDSIRYNIKTLQLTDNTTVLSGDVMTHVVALRNVDLVLADPPYDFDRWTDLLTVLNLVLAPGGVVVTESGREIHLLSRLCIRAVLTRFTTAILMLLNNRSSFLGLLSLPSCITRKSRVGSLISIAELSLCGPA